MKQLQWDKLPLQQASKTVFKEDEPEKEQKLLRRLQLDGVWMEMEEDFKAKQPFFPFAGKFLDFWICLTIHIKNHPRPAQQNRAELKSVLDPRTKKHVGMFV